MKMLYIMRHAKSDWSGPAADFERPLNRRGVKDVPRMARFLATGNAPDRVLSSAAARARQTAEGMAAGPGAAGVEGEQPLLFDQRLYGADPDTLTAVASQVDAGVDSLLVVAHNPGVEDWVRSLCGARVRMPTAAIACIALNIPTWAELPDATGQLRWFVTPKIVKAVGG